MLSLPPGLTPEAQRLAVLERENRKLRTINRVLMDRVERDMDSQASNAFSLFQTAITLENKVSERTAALTGLTHQLLHEINERREAERALRGAKAEAEQANFSKTRFLAAASHDLHQPLNAARLFLGALGEEIGSPRGAELVERIEAALDSVDDLLSALLDISRLDGGSWQVEKRSFALGPMLARLGREYEPQAQSVGLRLRVVPTGAVIHTDPRLFERILRNLISNAIRYTASGSVLLGCRRRGEELSVQVLDTGIGIPREKWARIFEEFHQLGNGPREHDKGLGLGLAIVDRIAKLLGLPIELDSRVGVGSRFAVRVPRGAVLPPEESGVPGQSVLTADVGGRCAVVIDDDDQVLHAMVVLLESWNCGVLGARSAAEALAVLAASGKRPDLVVADYQLEDGALGTEAVAAVRARYGADIPSLVVSANRAPEIAVRIKAEGHSFLPKPMAPSKLRAMLGFLMSRCVRQDVTG